MATCTQSISLDVAVKAMYKYVYAKQGDSNSRFVKVKLLENGSQIVPPSGSEAKIRAEKPDGTAVFNPAVINVDGTITAELTDQMLAVDGEVYADIMLTLGEQILSTVTFVIIVEAAPGGAQIESSNEFLEIIQVKEKIGNLEDLETTDKSSIVGAINEVNRSGGGGGGASHWSQIDDKPFDILGDSLKVESGVLEVKTSDTVEGDNTLPITSAAVYTEVGNIGALLALI